MPLREKHPHLVRLVRGDRGEVRMRDGIGSPFRLRRIGSVGDPPGRWSIARRGRAQHGGPAYSAFRFAAQDLKTVSEFTVKAGETVPFVLSYGASHSPVPENDRSASKPARTNEFWKKWISGCTYRGRYEDR